MTEEATIKIRKRRNLTDFFLKFHLFIDGKEIGTICNGKEELFRVSPGGHSISILSSWGGFFGHRTKKIDITLAPSDSKSFECGTVPWNWLPGMIVPVLLCIFLCSLNSQWLRVTLAFTMLGAGFVVLFVDSKPGSVYYLKEIHDSQLP